MVKGLQGNEPVQWEVTFDMGPLFQRGEAKGSDEAELWNETFHHLAARSIVRDFEQLAERECEIEHGNLYVFLNNSALVLAQKVIASVRISPWPHGSSFSSCDKNEPGTSV